MVFSNSKEVKKLRRALMIIAACCFLIMAVLGFLALFTLLVIFGTLFIMAVMQIALLNFQYVKISVEKNRLIVRYYSIFSFERSFQTFDFPVMQLRQVAVNKYFLGLKWDIRFTIKVQKGLADYPPISLSALPVSKRARLVETLKTLIPKNQGWNKMIPPNN